jgi:hypothetical protein
MRNWFYQLSRGKQIAIAVLMAHICCLIALSADYFFRAAPKKRQKIAVNLVQIVPPKIPVQVKSRPVPTPKKLPPKPIPAEPTPQITPSPVAAPKVKPTAKSPLPPASKKAPPKATPLNSPQPDAHASLLKEIEANLESIASPSTPSKAKTVIHIPTLSEIAYHPNTEQSSDETIASFLQETLTLPEFGEVRMFLSIDATGHLQSLEILTSKSEKNAAFLKNRLPELQFPCLNGGASLTVVFSNAL